MARTSSQLTEVNQSSALLQHRLHLSLSWASLMHKATSPSSYICYPLSPCQISSHNFFSFLSLYVQNSFFPYQVTLLTKFVSSILSRYPPPNQARFPEDSPHGRFSKEHSPHDGRFTTDWLSLFC